MIECIELIKQCNSVIYVTSIIITRHRIRMEFERCEITGEAIMSSPTKNKNQILSKGIKLPIDRINSLSDRVEVVSHPGSPSIPARFLTYRLMV